MRLAAAVVVGACAASSATVFAQPARVPDTIAQRVMPCTSCHGREGRATPDGYFPRIAGKPVGYLFNQLVNFREGRRHYALMTYLVEHLTDVYLMEMAQYFAGLDVPYSAPPRAYAAPEVLTQGETLARRGNEARQIPACAQCHGDALMGVTPNVPGLFGLPRDYLIAQLGRWRTGERRAHAPDCMNTIASRLTAAEVTSVATWLAAQPVLPDAKPVARSNTPPPLTCGSAQ